MHARYEAIVPMRQDDCTQMAVGASAVTDMAPLQDAYKYASQTLKRNWTENLRVGVTTAFNSHTGTGTWKGEERVKVVIDGAG